MSALVLVLVGVCVLVVLVDGLIVGFGGALHEARQNGWHPDRPAPRPTDTAFDVDEVYAETALCTDCGAELCEVVRVVDGAGDVQASGVEEAAELHKWHRALECTGVRA